MRKYTNKTGLPDAVCRALIKDDYNRGESDITVTQLIQPVRQWRLQQIHDDDIVEDFADLIWRVVGKIGHFLFEQADVTTLPELRVYKVIRGWKLGGQFDSLSLENYVLTDYKFTTRYAFTDGMKPEFEQQENMYRLLIRENGGRADFLKITAIFRDWSKRQVGRVKDYPQFQSETRDVRVWPYPEIEGWVDTRVGLFQQYVMSPQSALPECTPKERWAKGSGWAVMSPTAKRAKAVVSTYAEAEELAREIKGGRVEERPGENTRCELYCNVSMFCDQYKELCGTQTMVAAE